VDRAVKYNEKMGKRYEECVRTRARPYHVCPRTIVLSARRMLTPSWPCTVSQHTTIRSPFGGVDLWFVLGLAAFLVPFGGLAVGLATGVIHTPANF
jgi:hypothetical protein